MKAKSALVSFPQTDRYFLESVRQTSSRPQRPLGAEFENIKRIEGDLFMLSATFKV
jgi:hypothetical protein